MLTALVLLCLGAGEGLGPPLRQDGYTWRPPQAFRMARMDLFHGTRAGTVTPSPAAGRYLSAALLDGEGEDAASLLVSVVEASFGLGPSSRDVLSTAAVRHFRDELGLAFALERADVVAGRVEVLGSIRDGSQLRRVLVVAWPAELRHVVLVASVPSGRWDALRPVLSQSLDTMRLEAATGPGPSRRLRYAFAALVGALLLVSIGLWHRRRSVRG